MPGAGGGSVRTAEINARLADRFDVDVVSATYPGCRPDEDGGVRYSFAGLARGPPNGADHVLLRRPVGCGPTPGP